MDRWCTLCWFEYDVRVLTAVVLAALVSVLAMAVAALDRLAGSNRLVTRPGGGGRAG